MSSSQISTSCARQSLASALLFFQVRSLVNDRLARLLRVPRRGVKVTRQFDSSRKASNYESKPLNRSIKHSASTQNESQTDAQMNDAAASCVPNCNNVMTSPDSSDMTSAEPMTSSQLIASRQSDRIIELLETLVLKMAARTPGERLEGGERGGAVEMDEWRFTALVLDRVCFWLMAAFQLISSGTMFVLSITSGR